MTKTKTKTQTQTQTKTKTQTQTKTKTKTNSNIGFSIFEISVIVLIISIMIVLVLGGRHLKFTSEMTRIIADIQKYENAVRSFNDTYHTTPGDYKLAYDTFNCGTSPFVCSNYKALGASICNGAGYRYYDTASDAVLYCHTILAAKQLQIAKLLEYEYSLDYNDFGGNSAISGNYQKAMFTTYNGNGKFLLLAHTNHSTPLTLRVGRVNNDFEFENFGQYGFLIPEAMLSLDIKIDDGIANTGTLRFTGTQNNIACVNNAQYNVALSTLICYIDYLIK